MTAECPWCGNPVGSRDFCSHRCRVAYVKDTQPDKIKAMLKADIALAAAHPRTPYGMLDEIANIYQLKYISIAQRVSRARKAMRRPRQRPGSKLPNCLREDQIADYRMLTTKKRYRREEALRALGISP